MEDHSNTQGIDGDWTAIYRVRLLSLNFIVGSIGLLPVP
jgi:hypothetical protein